MVVHGGAGDAFWSDVKSGAQDAASQVNAALDYQTSDQLKQQADYINLAVSKKVKGIIVSIPTVDALRGPIEAAEAAGIPVVVINSGASDWKSVGAIGYVGQDESVAGQEAGKAMKDSGVKSMLCINVTQVIQAVDQRCAAATQGFGGPTQTVRVNPSDIPSSTAAISAKLQSDPSIDGVLSLGGGVFAQSAAGIKAAGSKAKLGTFDVNKDITAALKDGTAAFAVDQQPYIQGYQAVITSALYDRKNLLIGGGSSTIASGPRILTKQNAG